MKLPRCTSVRSTVILVGWWILPAGACPQPGVSGKFVAGLRGLHLFDFVPSPDGRQSRREENDIVGNQLRPDVFRSQLRVPGRSAHQAVAQAQQYIVEGHGWCVDLDLEKFFDRVNHDKLMGRVAKRVGDKRLLKLIRSTAGRRTPGTLRLKVLNSVARSSAARAGAPRRYFAGDGRYQWFSLVPGKVPSIDTRKRSNPAMSECGESTTPKYRPLIKPRLPDPDHGACESIQLHRALSRIRSTGWCPGRLQWGL